MRFRVKYSKANGQPLSLSDNIAPSMCTISNLFQSMEFRINDQVVSRLSDYCVQIDTLQHRLDKSRSWMNGFGNSINFMSDSFEERQSAICFDALRYDEITASVAQGPPLDRVLIGLDAPDGVNNNRNALAYDNATSVVTLSVNGGQAPLPDISTVLPVGSYLQYTAIGAGAPTDARLRKPVRVIQILSPTTALVEAGVIGADIPEDGRTDFQRVDSVLSRNSQDESRKAGEVELIYQLPLSIFKIPHGICGGARYELSMVPHPESTLQKRAIESRGADKVPGTNYKFEVLNCFLYVHQVEGPRMENQEYLVDMTNINCQTEKVMTNNFSQVSVDVSPATHSLVFAYQDTRQGSDTRVSPAKFKSYDDAVTQPLETNLTRAFHTYAGVSRPNPDIDNEFKSGRDFTVQRYFESMIANGSAYDSGSAETIQEFLSRGQYFAYTSVKDPSDRSSRVMVHQQFSEEGGVDPKKNMRLLCFSIASQVAKITVQGGEVVSVNVVDL